MSSKTQWHSTSNKGSVFVNCVHVENVLAAATSTVEGAADLKFLLLKILKLFFSSNKLDKLTALGLLTDGSNVNKTIGSQGYKQKIHEKKMILFI